MESGGSVANEPERTLSRSRLGWVVVGGIEDLVHRRFSHWLEEVVCGVRNLFTRNSGINIRRVDAIFPLFVCQIFHLVIVQH